MVAALAQPDPPHPGARETTSVITRAVRRTLRAAWAPLLAAVLAGGCTSAVIGHRRAESADRRLGERADVVAAAIATIESDVQHAVVALDSALTITGVVAPLATAIDTAIEPPTLVSTIAIVDASGAIVAANRDSTAIRQSLPTALGMELPRAPAAVLVATQADRDRDLLVFAAAARTGSFTLAIELVFEPSAFEDLPPGTAFTLTADDAIISGPIARTDAAITEPASTRGLTIGGRAMTLRVSGTDQPTDEHAWAAVTLAALCAAVVTMTLQSAYRWRAERRTLDRDELLLDGALAHQQRVEADLRMSETQLRAVLASTPDTVAILEPVSRRLRLLNRDDLIGHDAPSFEQDGFILTVAGDDSDFRLWWAALAMGPLDGNRSIEFWATSAEGQPHRLQLRVAPLRGAGLSLQHRCLGVITDVTEQHAQREREDRMRDELERVRHLESLGRLAGGIAHDFRNVLAAVDINAELLAARAEPDALRCIDVIRRATGRASDIIQQLLSFAKRDLGEPVLVDLNQAVLGLEAVLRSSVGSTVTIELDLDPLPCSTRAGPGQLDRLILNLVCNARDALLDGGEIRISTRHDRGAFHPGSEERDWIKLVVADNGIGIPDDVIDKVFEPFFTTKGGAGSGLGLASVHGIVSALGGHVAISSTVGLGTSVTIALPATRGAPTEPPGADHERRTGGRRIILVDHDSAQREPTARLLRECGFDVIEAANASDGLAAMAQCPPDVLVTDLVIPGAMNGLDLAERARHEFPGVAVLFVSGYADAVIADGSPIPHRFVSKPVSAGELLDALHVVSDAAD
jgi:signal transduction histidine kinase